MEPKSALGAIYSTRLASFYPEGNMPEGMSDAASDGLPFLLRVIRFVGRIRLKHCMIILVYFKVYLETI